MEFAQPGVYEVAIVWHNVVVEFYSAFVESFRNNKKVKCNVHYLWLFIRLS